MPQVDPCAQTIKQKGMAGSLAQFAAHKEAKLQILPRALIFDGCNAGGLLGH
jgi:hypothetical protein